MGLLEDIKAYIKKKINGLYDNIKDVNNAIRTDIANRINVSNQSILDINLNLGNQISKAFVSNEISLDNITKLLSAEIDFSSLITAINGIKLDVPKPISYDFTDVINAIKKISDSNILKDGVSFTGLGLPLEKALESMVNLSENKIVKHLMKGPYSETLKDINEYNEIRKKDHITTFEGFMKWSNEIWAITMGIKPFNIIFGKESWLDETKKGIYYDTVRGIVFSYLFFTWGQGVMNSFFTKMSDQKITEHYAYSKLTIQEYQKLNFRGIVKDDELKAMALFLGFNERAMELVNKTTKFYPSVRDSIDFAVREAFEPDENLFIHGGNAIPLPFKEIADKLGIDEIWVKRFWHSHWRLLGAGQLLEGFHRGFLNKDELLDYLRRLDYVEKDRKLIMDMSYNLLTRVDIRRIFEQGLISSMDLYNYYGKLGFTEKDQALMTNLAKQMRFIDTNDLRKIYIERFENGLISENEIKELLHNTGLDLDEINGYLELSDGQKELEFVIELKKRIETKFYEGDIDFDELVQQLRQLGVSNRELKRIEKNAILFDFRKKKLPTLAELKRYYKKNIIDLNKFVYYALRLGLEKEHIFWILQDMSE